MRVFLVLAEIKLYKLTWNFFNYSYVVVIPRRCSYGAI